MPIDVGVNKNVFIVDARFNTEKNWLEIDYDTVDPKKPTSAYDLLNQDTVVDVSPVKTMYLFTPSVPKNEDGKLTQEKMVARVTGDMKGTKDILNHTLLGYMTVEEAKLNPFKGMDLDADTFPIKILQESTLKKVMENVSTQFIEKMKPFFNKPTLAFRFLLIRQAKDKHFASYRKNYIAENPFWEPMEISDEASKVKFSDYEIAQNLTNATPLAASSADNKKTGQSANSGGAAPSGPALTASTVFGD